MATKFYHIASIFIMMIMTATLAGCGNDEPGDGLFVIFVKDAPQGTEISIDGTECGISTNGEAQTIEIMLKGDYDSFTIENNSADWITVTSGKKTITLTLKEFGGGEFDSRNAALDFTVYKDNSSTKGRIIVHQYALTKEDLLKRERKAIEYFLSQQKVIDELPANITEIKQGEDAPYYNVKDGKVYMQVVSMGTAGPAISGEKIYFRVMRYNLLDYLKNGLLPKGEGNADNISDNYAFFELGSDKPSTTQWGEAIQLPMQLGLPADSEVNIVVASEAGLTAEISNIIPFLYHIRYYKAIN